LKNKEKLEEFLKPGCSTHWFSKAGGYAYCSDHYVVTLLPSFTLLAVSITLFIVIDTTNVEIKSNIFAFEPILYFKLEQIEVSF